MKQLKTFFIVVLFFGNSYSQDSALDSLKLAQKEKNIAEELFQKGKYITATKQCKKALKILPDNELERKIEFNYLIGKYFQHSRSLDSAQYYYNIADKLFNDSISSRVKSIKYEAHASYFYAKEQIDSVMINALKSLEFATISNDYKQITRANYTLGLFFLAQKKLDNAKEYIQKAFEVAHKNNDSILIEYTHVYIGQLEFERKKYNKAEFRFKKALSFFKKKNYRQGIFRITSLLTKLYLIQGRLNESTKYSFEALKVINEIEYNPRDHIFKLIHNANLVQNLSSPESTDIIKIDSAKTILEDGLNYVDNIHTTLEHNKGMVKFYEENLEVNEVGYSSEDIQKKLNEKLYKTIKLQDSLYQNSLQSNYLELEKKYKTQEKEKENLQLQNEAKERELVLAKENRQKWIFGIISLGIAMTLGIFIFFYRRNRKQKRFIEYLQREMHHRVKNNLSIINAFIDNANDEDNKAMIEEKLQDLQNRIDSIYEIHEQLYISKDVANFNVKQYINTLSKNIQKSFYMEAIEIKNNIDSQLEIDADKSFSIGLIVNEFLTNSFKYAFKENNGLITIDFKKDKDNYYLSLSDNGRGLPEDIDIQKLKSYGLRIITLLVEQLEGSYLLENNNGVSLKIKFPKV